MDNFDLGEIVFLDDCVVGEYDKNRPHAIVGSAGQVLLVVPLTRQSRGEWKALVGVDGGNAISSLPRMVRCTAVLPAGRSIPEASWVRIRSLVIERMMHCLCNDSVSRRAARIAAKHREHAESEVVV